MNEAGVSKTLALILEDCDPKNLGGLDWLATNGRYISAEQLADAIEANPGQVLPAGLHGYLCRFLRGKIKKKPGPKSADSTFRFIVEWFAVEEYHKELDRLQRERRHLGREAIGKGELSPHEQALMIVKERFKTRFGSVTPRRIANIISSHS